MSSASTPLADVPLPFDPLPTPARSRRRAPAPSLAEIPHVWDGEILMTTVRGAADLLGCTPQTIRNWIRAGRVTGVRFQAGGTRRWIPVRGLWRGDAPAWYVELLDRQRMAARHASASKAAGAAESPSV